MRRSWTLRNGLALTSIAFVLAVGVVAVLDSILLSAGPFLPVVWWMVYAVFGAVLLAIQDFIPRPGWLHRTILLISLITMGVVLVLLFCMQGSAGLLFVMTASIASFFWSSTAVTGVIALQTCVVALAGVLGGWPVADLVVGVTVFGISQVFGALVVFTARSEAEARRELAVAHADLRSTTALLRVSTREAERLRIARDLHDLTGHHLTALSLELEVASHLTASDAGGEHVRRARSIAKDLLGTVRAAVSKMRTEPPSLSPALHELATGVPGLDFSVEVRGEHDVTPEQAITILRCVQEAITNTLRHSDAHSVRIHLDADTEEIRVVISDDGEGTARVVPGHGLTGMRERVELLGGTLKLQSSPGSGFTVTATFPHGSATERASR